MPSAKRRKIDEPRYECVLCGSARISSAFPDTLPSEECEHLINTCTLCLRNYIDASLKDQQFTGTIPCPECPAKMRPSDVEEFARRTTIKRFNKLENRRNAELTPGWCWCLNPDCESGQVYIINPDSKEELGNRLVQRDSKSRHLAKSASTGVQKGTETVAERPAKRTTKKKSKVASTKKEPLEPFVCNDCGSRYCMVCVSTWHEGQSCAEHQRRIKAQHAKDDAKSLAAIAKIAKQCPKCQIPIQRSEGCNHMICSLCSERWCYRCVEKANECTCLDPQVQYHVAADQRNRVGGQPGPFGRLQ